MIKKILPFVGMLAIAPFAGAAEETASAQTVEPQTVAETATPELPAEKKALFLKIIGCWFAAQNGLEFAELTPEETASVVEGFKLGIDGKIKDLQAEIKANETELGRFMQELEERIRTKADAASRAEMEKLAKENKAKGAAYIEKCKADDESFKELESGVLIKIDNPGDANIKPNPESYITVRYTGKFIDGSIFDSSERNPQTSEPVQFTANSEPAAFPFPLKQLIQGWIESFQMLGKGAKATLVIPSDQAYGDQPGRLPPGSTLVFDIELVDVSDKAPEETPQPEVEVSGEVK